MAISAIILLILGIALIGFSALSFQNIGDMPVSDGDDEQVDEMGKSYWRWHIKVALIGAILLAIGAALAVLTEA